MHPRFAYLPVAALAVLLLASAIPVHAQQKEVVVLHLDEAIDPGSAHFIAGTLNSLNNQTTKAAIIEMNTPGGLLISMLDMVQAINKTEARGIPVYTYIPPDSNGASAGSYVAMATDVIGMGNGSYIGPSTPIVVGGTSLEQNHTQAAMQALMVSLASAHGRNTTAATSMVANNTAYDAKTAVNIGIAEKLSDSLTSFMNSLNLSGYSTASSYPSFYDNFISFLSNSFVDGILILLGAIAIIADFFHGTVVLSVAGITLLFLGFLGAEIISASIVGLILLILGVAIMFIEVKTGHGIALVSGVAVGLVGTFLLAAPYSSSNPGYSPYPYGPTDYFFAAVTFILAVIVAFLLRYVVRSLKRKRYTGSESLLDQKGTVKKQLSPKGWISIEGVSWKAVSDDGTTIKENETVVVLGIEGLTLRVKKV